MKILFFSYAFPNPINPGLGTFNRTMIAGLANEHEVRVVSPVPFTESWNAWSKGKLPRGLNDSTFQAVPNVPTEYCSWYYTPKLFRNQYGHFMHRSVGSTLNRAMREFQPDIVLSYWTHPDGEVAVKTAHRFGVRAVAMVGGSDVLINARHGVRRNATLEVLREADGVVAVSEDIQQVLISDGIPTNKLHVARRGVDRRIFHEGNIAAARQNLNLPDDRPIAISVGRLVDVKGHAHLIDACELLSRRGVKFRCYLLGDGPLRTELERRIEERRLHDVIQLRGSQTPSLLAEWYRAANLSVLASLSEGVPNVLLESIACGTPFVASNVGGIPEIADVEIDCLVSAGDPTALANAIESRLAVKRSDFRKARRFEPPSVSESTRNLSRILQSIQTGRAISVHADDTLHETMTEKDVSNDAVTSSTIGRTDVSDAEIASTSENDSVAAGTEVLLGRTGEMFYSRKSL